LGEEIVGMANVSAELVIADSDFLLSGGFSQVFDSFLVLSVFDSFLVPLVKSFPFPIP
jgi:hypothetical protein